MKNDLDSIMSIVKQFDSTDLIQDWIVVIVSHIVRGYRRQRIAFECKDSTFEENLVFIGKEFRRCWNRFHVPIYSYFSRYMGGGISNAKYPLKRAA